MGAPRRAFFVSTSVAQGFALSLAGMAFPRPKKRSYTEDELYEYAVGALARRMRTVAELKRLMRARVEDVESEYGQTLVELVIRRLKDQGYLNDSQYAASYSSLRRDNQKLGRRRVITELKTRGVHGDVIEKAVEAAYDGVSDEKQAREFLRKKRLAKPKDQKADGARFPATGAGWIWDEDYLHDPEEVGRGRRNTWHAGRARRSDEAKVCARAPVAAVALTSGAMLHTRMEIWADTIQEEKL